MSRHFNLVSEKWIPVVSRSGVQEEVGLERIFTDPEILDLIVSPCERISLMALFAAIAHAAVEGPATYEDWCNLPKALPVAASSYLAKWRDCFDLWSEDKPFLQLPGLRYTQADRKLNMASKLDFAAAAGSNSCLFDNSFDQAIPRTYRDAELALRLLTYQCFSPGGLIGIVNWRGHASGMEKKSEAALYGVDGAWHAIVQRPTLLHTLIFNLPTRAQVADQGWTNWGKALWEQMPQGYEDHAAICNATRSYLGRLIPLSRSILLNPDRKHLVLGNGLSYPRSLPPA
jgi:CRISPR system Cascade subunit CasA